MAAPKLLDVVPGEGDRSQWTAIITGVVNVAMLAASTFGFTLPFEVWAGVNTVLATAFTLFFADKLNRNTEATLAIAAKQPTETPVVVVTTNDPAVKVSATGAEVIR